jgi:hypothetical protein
MLNFKDIFKSMYFENENQTYDTYCKSLFEFQRKDNFELIKIDNIDNETEITEDPIVLSNDNLACKAITNDNISQNYHI